MASPMKTSASTFALRRFSQGMGKDFSNLSSDRLGSLFRSSDHEALLTVLPIWTPGIRCIRENRQVEPIDRAPPFALVSETASNIDACRRIARSQVGWRLMVASSAKTSLPEPDRVRSSGQLSGNAWISDDEDWLPITSLPVAALSILLPDLETDLSFMPYIWREMQPLQGITSCNIPTQSQ